MEPKPIRNIIFDFGGVILNIDYSLTFKRFKEFGFHDVEQYFNRVRQTPLFDHLETGHISPEQFRDGIRKLTGLKLEDHQIDEAWNAMLLDLPPIRMELLKLAHGRYRTFLLSNTNAIHKEAFMNSVEKQYGKGTFESYFEKVYFSHELGMRKPGVEIYTKVLMRNNLDPEETLFIDDSPSNIQGAEKAGLQTLYAHLPLEYIREAAGLLDKPI